MSNPVFNPVWEKAVNRSLRMVGAYNADGTPSATQTEDALDVLNAMLKAWQTDDHLWLKTFCTLFLNKGQTVYKLGPLASGGSHCVTSYVQTNLSVTTYAGSNTVTIDSATGIATGDYIGIADDNGLIEWFTATVAGNTITLSANVAAQCSAGNVAYSHKVDSQIERPTRIFTAARKLYSTNAVDGIEVEIMQYGRQEYAQMPNKTITGKIVQYYYDPQLIAGNLFVWPTADTPNDKMVLTVDRPIQAITLDTDTFDLPMEWLDAIAFCLAERLFFEYPASASEYQLLAQRSSIAKEAILSYDREPASFNYQREYR